jgi:hypothetical protein
MGKQRNVRIGSGLSAGVATLVLMIVSVVTFILLSDKPYGIQLATATVYSLGIVYLVFFSNKLGTGFELNSSAVRRSAQHLLLWHIFVLALLVAFQSVALKALPNLPVWLTKEDRRHRTVFETLLTVVFVVVAFAQATKFRNILRKEELKQMREERLR